MGTVSWPEGIEARSIDTGDADAWAEPRAAKEHIHQEGHNYRPEDLHLQRFLTAAKAPEDALVKVAHAIGEHVEITERPEGLYDEISTQAPHLATKIDRLREEHPVLRDRTQVLLTK